MKKILIIGGTGLIGTEIIKRLHDNFNIVSFSKNIPPKHLNKFQNVKFICGDVLNKSQLEKAFEGVELVINLIGQIIQDEKLFEKINIEGNKNIIKLIKKHNVNLTILASSMLVYGETTKDGIEEKSKKNPKSKYGKIKSQVEDIYLNSINKVIILRFSNVYGNHQTKGIMSKIIQSIKEKKEINVPTKEKIRNYINSLDIAEAIEKIIRYNTPPSKIYNVCGIERTDTRDLIKLFELKSGHTLKKVFNDIEDENIVVGNTTLIENELNFKPKIKLEKGVIKILKNEKLL
jgi:dTDP-glucose 4,6-dehydratase